MFYILKLNNNNFEVQILSKNGILAERRVFFRALKARNNARGWIPQIRTLHLSIFWQYCALSNPCTLSSLRLLHFSFFHHQICQILTRELIWYTNCSSLNLPLIRSHKYLLLQHILHPFNILLWHHISNASNR